MPIVFLKNFLLYSLCYRPTNTIEAGLEVRRYGPAVALLIFSCFVESYIFNVEGNVRCCLIKVLAFCTIIPTCRTFQSVRSVTGTTVLKVRHKLALDRVKVYISSVSILEQFSL